jgi:DNA repair protein RadC
MSLSKMPVSERPRERLLRYGVDALSLAELLAILLTTGTKGKTVLELAQELTCRFGGLEGLLEASIEELGEVKGLGQTKAIQLKAAFGIALRRSATPFNQHLKTAKEAYDLIKDDLSAQKQEVILVILKDVRGRLICYEKVSIGTLSHVLVHPREVFYPAVRHKANSLILAHNHPSGDPTPSPIDLKLTRHLLTCSHVMRIGLDDHLIVGKDSFTSLKEAGYLESI